MKNNETTRRDTLAGMVALTSLAGANTRAAANEPGRILEQAFSLSELTAERARSSGPYLRFFDNETMSAGLYELAKGVRDDQPVHARDEMYFVAKGVAKLRAGEEVFAVGPGSIFFVAAGVSHRFEDIAEDLQVIVFFSKVAL